ncbi:hypothetical protein [Fluviicola sp.]|uniref:hypothetical protein n=1 Tax=Fluviicola sp. TaxID=1917219 RepID=UPI0031E1527F
MTALSQENQIRYVSSFQELISEPFRGEVNAIGWMRQLAGDFSEIVDKIELTGNITEVDPEELLELTLSEDGQLARSILLNDLEVLKAHGAAPVLNIISQYDKDEDFPFFPTDVYSFHADRSPIPTSTFLCTYQGDASEIVPNAQATQKIQIPEIRNELRKLYDGKEAGFEEFLTENFFDLHYQAAPDARIINLGVGNIWKLAVDHPGNPVLPCIHRAPHEHSGQKRLLLIC